MCDTEDVFGLLLRCGYFLPGKERVYVCGLTDFRAFLGFVVGL